MTPGVRIVSIATASAVLVVLGAAPAARPAFSPWGPAVNLGPTINTASIDAGAALSRDGLSLYFNSNRAGGYGDNDIWVSQRASVQLPFEPPRNLGAEVNTGASEGVPALSRDGHWLVFNSTRAGGHGNQDLWVSYRAHTHDDFAWEAPVNVGSPVNSAAFDAGAGFFENDEAGLPLLFFGSTRSGGLGSFDLYVATATAEATFADVMPVMELNSTGNDQRPSVAFDGLEVLLQSDRAGTVGGADIWAATRDSLMSPWAAPVNLGPMVNSTSTDQQPHLASDRQTLLFASNRPGGFGGLDIYVASRAKVPVR